MKKSLLTLNELKFKAQKHLKSFKTQSLRVSSQLIVIVN